MAQQRVLLDPSVWKTLATKLAQVEGVHLLDRGEEKEAWTLVHALADLEGSFRKVLDEQLPSLLAENQTPEETEALLLEIGEEFRHILYHLRDTRYYDYLTSTEA